MVVTKQLKQLYKKLQDQLFYMIPEKWEKICLYASVEIRPNSLQTGEMYFYYFPKSMLRKKPVNVYEIPSRFNIEENAYINLVDKLYDTIKQIHIEFIKSGQKPWTNLSIRIEDNQFIVEFRYDDLINSMYSSYDRHIIWQYEYLGISLDSMNKKDRNMIEKYINQSRFSNQAIDVYTESIYPKPSANSWDMESIKEDNNKSLKKIKEKWITPKYKEEPSPEKERLSELEDKLKIKDIETKQEEMTGKSQILRFK